MALDSKEKTIKALYSKACYTIPNYQRGYAWKKADVEQLIEDLQEAIEMGKDFYFLSSLTVCLESDAADKKSDNEFVIDGQQRLITISLIMRALLDIVTQNSTIHADLITCLKVSDAPEKTRLSLDNKEDKESFENHILNKGISTKNVLRINEAYSVIKEKISNEQYPTKFAEFLLNDTYVVKNLVLNEEYACQIFESLNDRGVPLTAFDLIKNRLFLLSLDSNHTQKKIQNIQGAIKGSLGNGRTLSPNTRDYFRVYLQVNNGKKFVDDGGMYKEFKDQVKDEISANEFIDNLNNDDSILSYLSLKNGGLSHKAVHSVIEKMPNLDHLRHYFNRINGLKICQPVLFALFIHMDKEAIRDTLQDLYCLIVRTGLLNIRLSKIQDMLSNISSQMYHNKNKSFSVLLKNFLNSNDEYKSINQLEYISNFKATLEGYANIKEPLAKDILFDICLFSDKKSSIQSFQKPYKDVSIEHILPQTLEGNYPKINADEHKLYLNNLGNHSILETGDNSRNSNDDISIKLRTFNSEKYQGFPVVNNIKDYLIEGEWTVKSIKNRKKALINSYVKLVKFSWE